MMAQCVIPVASNQSLEFVGNVRNVLIMIYALSATMEINIIYVTGSSIIYNMRVHTRLIIC